MYWWQYLLGKFPTSFHSIQAYNKFQRDLHLVNNVVLHNACFNTLMTSMYVNDVSRLEVYYCIDAESSRCIICIYNIYTVYI